MSHPAPDAEANQRPSRSPLFRYGLAFVVVAAAIALRSWLDAVIGQPSVAIFMAAILIGAWAGGVGPALICLIALHVVHGYRFQKPPGLWESNLSSAVTIAGWYAVGITVGILSDMRSAAQQRAHKQQMEAQKQREQFRSTLSCMADGVIVADANGRLTLMNPAAEALTGWNLAEAIGKSWREVFAIHGADRHESAETPIERVLGDGGVVHESVPVMLTSRRGRTLPIAYSAAPVKTGDGTQSGIVLVFRDESERRRFEQALQNADRRKEEFLAVLGHELRNPLAPICTGLELLKASGGDPQTLADVRAMMQRQVQHMVRLIDDLLDVSRISRGKLELRKSEVQLPDIVRDAVAATRPLFDEAEHQLTVVLPEKPVRLYADANRLTQVITNLLNNAAKYTPREGRVALSAEQAGGVLTITVRDSGIGIPADRLDSVFDMFVQIHDSTEYRQPGLGIGLTLVKRLVEMHGGSVAVQSDGRNRGTAFVVRLPALPVAATHTIEELSNFDITACAVKRRVLVVDDHADALESLSRLVTLMGHEVRQACDGLQALEVGRTFQPEVVLMDLGMPNLNGFAAAQRIRQEPWGAGVMLVATTGWGQDEARRRSADAGFDRHLVKPIQVSELRDCLHQVTSAHSGTCHCGGGVS
jgi:PAS domain S-box-containing protein